MSIISMNLWGGLMRRQELNPKFRSLYSSFSVFLKFCLLAVTIFLFGGNENANPTVGNSTVEFYSSEFRHQIYTDIAVFEKGYNANSVESLVNKFYKQRQYMPAWTLNFKTNQAYDDLFALLQAANSYGLNNTAYSVDELKSIRVNLTNLASEDNRIAARFQLEKQLTTSAFSFMINLSTGLNTDKTDSTYTSLINKLPGYLNLIISSDNVREGVLNLQPHSEQYKMLQAALVKFLQNVKLNSIEYSSDNIQMTKGLTERILIEQGFLDKAFENDSNAVKTALQHYQVLNSLDPTGIADVNTYSRLGRSTSDIFNQIALNLDRLRKDELKSENYILVNIPEFILYYVNETGVMNNFNVVVGKNDSPTPILSSEIELIVTNPHWTVPNSIALNEIIPKIITDSTYLAKHGYKIVDKDAKPVDESAMDWKNMDQSSFKYYIRQDIGEKNALGVIKFLFPNEHSVYLHDTPSKQYFKKEIRAFSHGCVRVENPEKLAQLIITDHCMNNENISMKSLLGTKKQRAIKIDEPVPIYIKYYTCTADSNGNIFFHPDVYSYDEEAIEQLFASNYQE